MSIPAKRKLNKPTLLTPQASAQQMLSVFAWQSNGNAQAERFRWTFKNDSPTDEIGNVTAVWWYPNGANTTDNPRWKGAFRYANGRNSGRAYQAFLRNGITGEGNLNGVKLLLDRTLTTATATTARTAHLTQQGITPNEFADFTVMCWHYWNTASGGYATAPRIFDTGFASDTNVTTGTSGYQGTRQSGLSVRASSNVLSAVRNTSTTDTDANFGGARSAILTLPQNEWFHVAIVVRSTADGVNFGTGQNTGRYRRMYVNGVLVHEVFMRDIAMPQAMRALSLLSVPRLTTSGQTQAANTTAGMQGSSYDAQLWQDIRVFDKALSGNDIVQCMNEIL